MTMVLERCVRKQVLFPKRIKFLAKIIDKAKNRNQNIVSHAAPLRVVFFENEGFTLRRCSFSTTT